MEHLEIRKVHLSETLLLIGVLKYLTKKNKQKIVNLDYIIDIARNSRLQNLTNYFVEKGLKTLRYFRKYS